MSSNSLQPIDLSQCQIVNPSITALRIRALVTDSHLLGWLRCQRRLRLNYDGHVAIFGIHCCCWHFHRHPFHEQVASCVMSLLWFDWCDGLWRNAIGQVLRICTFFCGGKGFLQNLNVNIWVQVKMQILGNSDTPRLWLWTVMSILGNIWWLPDGALIAGVGSDGCDGLTKMIAAMTSKNDCPSGDDIKVGIVLVLRHQARMVLLTFQGHALAECFRSSKCQQKMSGNDFV